MALDMVPRGLLGLDFTQLITAMSLTANRIGRLASIALLSSFAGAQSLVPPTKTQSSPPSVGPSRTLEEERAKLTDWRVPIHTSAADPKGGDYGIWASGPNYKASFHNGFTFYPLLGGAYPKHLPLHWKTRIVRVGAEFLLDRRENTGPIPKQCYTDWRFEYRFDDLTEAYDVGPKGVEQTFVLHRRPRAKGNLVIEGIATTPLTAKPRVGAHSELVFHDATGEPIIRYGAAFAVDANGRKIPIPTRFDGERIALEVPESWLAQAQFPVTIDPLTSSLVLVSSGTVETDVCRNDELDRLLITFTRRSTATDLDVHASVYTSRYRILGLLFVDITAAWSTDRAYCAYNGAVNRWAIAIGRRGTSWSGVRVYHDDHARVVPGSGEMLYVSSPRGYQDAAPTVGGTGGFTLGNNVYLAWRRDFATRPQNNLNSVVWGCPVDLRGTGTLGTARALSALQNTDQDMPSINRRSLGNDWVVVWQQRFQGSSNADYKIVAARISYAGVHRGYGSFGSLGTANHKLKPRIEGAQGRWLCLFEQYPQNDPSRRRTYAQRGDWAGSGTMRTLPSVPLGRWSYTGRNLAYNSSTDSHWATALTFQETLRVFRFGFQGNIVAAANPNEILQSSTWHSASMTYNEGLGRYHIVHCPATFGGEARGLDLTLPDARCRSVGPGCAGQSSCWNRGRLPHLPYLGSEYFGIRLTNAIPSHPYMLMISPNVRPYGLPISGPGCELWLGQSMMNLEMTTTSATGVATVTGALLESPWFDIGCQWLTIENGLLKSSNGLEIVAR